MTQKIVTIFMIAIFVIALATITINKYQIAYVVMLNGQKIGFVKDKEEFQNRIDNEILKTTEDNVAFVSLDSVDYEPQVITRDIIDENIVFDTIKQSSKKIYRVYEVADNNSEDIVYVNSIEQAEELVNTLKQDYNEIEPDLKITTLYLEQPVTEDAINEAKTKITEDLNNKLTEKKARDKRTVNGVYLACLPLNGGTITSRFGSRESIRSHAHTGLDLSARYGTPIYAVAEGTVKFAGRNNGGYGNLVIIDHGNGVQTYYGHCSSIVTKVGVTVSAGDLIAKVGSTGNSTGNHLHFEVRINGKTVNPQKYIY